LSLQLGDLRAALMQLGLSAAGKRPVLAARLAAALRSAAAAAADSDADGDEMDPGA
jgi:hypothetical protein